MSANNLIDTSGLGLYVDTLFTLYENNNIAQVINRVQLLNKCLLHESNLSLESMLKLFIIYEFHLENDDISKKLLFELSDFEPSNPIFLPKIPLIAKAQEILLNSCQETPIFNYQFNSFKILTNSIKIHLGKVIQRILLNFNPSLTVVFKFYNSFISSEIPAFEILNTTPTRDSFLEYSKMI